MLADEALAAPARLIRTSPESPEADSRLVNAIAAIVSAKTRPDQVGALPRWIGSSSVCGLKNSTRPSTTMKRLQREVAGEQHARPGARGAPLKPRMLLSTTQRDERERQAERLAAVAERAPEASSGTASPSSA